MAYTVYNCTAIQGGAARSLDALTYATLVTGDRAICDVGGYLYIFKYSSTGTSAEQVTAHPYIIRPDDYTVGGNWTEVLPRGEYEQIQQTAITPSASSVSLAIPSGYQDVVLKIDGMYASCADGFLMYKNTTATAINRWDEFITTETRANATGDIACAAIPFAVTATMRMNYSAVDFDTFKMGTSQYSVAFGTITLNDASAATFQQVDADVRCEPIGGTGVLTGFHNGYHARSIAKAKSTAKMTGIVIVPKAGVFLEGTLTLLGRK